jgi:hypothetical protein
MRWTDAREITGRLLKFTERYATCTANRPSTR